MPGSIFNIQPKTTIVVTTWIQEWSNPEFNTNMVPKDSTGNYVSNGDEDESEYYKVRNSNSFFFYFFLFLVIDKPTPISTIHLYSIHLDFIILYFFLNSAYTPTTVS